MQGDEQVRNAWPSWKGAPTSEEVEGSTQLGTSCFLIENYKVKFKRATQLSHEGATLCRSKCTRAIWSRLRTGQLGIIWMSSWTGLEDTLEIGSNWNLSTQSDLKARVSGLQSKRVNWEKVMLTNCEFLNSKRKWQQVVPQAKIIKDKQRYVIYLDWILCWKEESHGRVRCSFLATDLLTCDPT